MGARRVIATSAVLAVKKTVRGALLECETYFESRADVADYSDETGHTPNEEMKLLTEVQEALAKLDSEDNWLERQLDSSKAETEAWSDEKKRIYGIDSEDGKEALDDA